MTFLSYAQNHEDVMLWRALQDVGQGFYIDIGANDPELDSVTKAFYDAGWHGVNVEPAEAHFRRLTAARPRDINLRAAAAANEGTVLFFDVADTGLSTTEAGIAEGHRRAGHKVTGLSVPATTLARICAERVEGEVHFLKIDVEGGTRAVLEGMDFTLVRPWILLIEATEPNTQTETHQDWEHIILQHGYSFVYADGLNRFYLSEDHFDLKKYFQYPPNVFDNTMLASHQLALRHLQEAGQHLQEAEQRADREREAANNQRLKAEDIEREGNELRAALTQQIKRHRDAEVRAFEAEQQAAQSAARLDEREALLRRVFESRSWRLTAPLRSFLDLLTGRSACARQMIHSHPARPTLFIECTHTYHSDLNTGIQRVVRNVLRNAPAVAERYGLDVVPVIWAGNRFEVADAGRVLANKQAGPTPIAEVAAPTQPPPALNWRGRARRSLSPLWRLSLKLLATAFPFATARRFIYTPRNEFGLARCIYLPLRFLRRLARGGQPSQPVNTSDQPLSRYESFDNSILLLLDSSWTIPLWQGVRQFRDRGGIVMGTIYDLIPLTHAHTSVPELCFAFETWLEDHLQISDGFICISRSTAETLEQYRQDNHNGLVSVRAETPIRYFHLGSELDFVTQEDLVRPEIRGIFGEDRYVFLMVGSIEPRKMHSYVLDAFDRYWARGGAGTLLIVGRQSWKTEAFLERVARHPQLGRQLFILRDATDAELDHCYRHASSLVIASEVEGFGLPVVEAFQRGLPVLCSDIPVFREIAEGKADFFKLGDPEELTKALEAFCRRVPLSQRLERTPRPWINWRESTEQLLAAIAEIRDARGGAHV